MSIQTELIADSKSTESSNKTKKRNTERVQNENKNMTHDTKQSISLQKNADSVSAQTNADNSEDISSTNSREIN